MIWRCSAHWYGAETYADAYDADADDDDADDDGDVDDDDDEKGDDDDVDKQVGEKCSTAHRYKLWGHAGALSNSISQSSSLLDGIQIGVGAQRAP